MSDDEIPNFRLTWRDRLASLRRSVGFLLLGVVVLLVIGGAIALELTIFKAKVDLVTE